MRFNPQAIGPPLVRIALLVLAAGSLGLAAYIWIEPTANCTVTVKRGGNTSSTKATQRTVGKVAAGARSRERTRERVRETKAMPARSGAASTDACTVPAVVASTVTVVEDRDAVDSKEFVLALVGLAAALSLAAAFYSRISKISVAGVSVEMQQFDEKTKVAAEDLKVLTDAVAKLSEGVTKTGSRIEKVQTDLDIETRRHSLNVERLELELAQLKARRGLRRQGAEGDNATDA